MIRRRQVRLSYPTVFVDLALYLAQRHGRMRAAKVLGLPLSTLYRWRDERRQAMARGDARTPVLSPDRLLAGCEAHGFDLRARVRQLEPLEAGAAAAETVAYRPTPSIGALPMPALAIAGAAGNEPARHRTAATNPIHARVQRARNEIDQRYYAPLSCDHLAGLAGMSRFHFIRMFKSVYAVAPYRCLMQVRVHHARLLLGTTQQPLDAIAAAVGFDSPSSLCKAFKSVEGISLSAYFRGMRLGAQPPRRPGSAPATARI
jgi:AraC-like DNA-binding protein